MRFDRSRTAIDTARQLGHLSIGDAIDVQPVALIRRNSTSASMRRLNKAHLLELGHFAANSGAGHTKQLG